ELAQPPQRHLDVAGAELDPVVEIPEVAPIPDLDGAPMAALVLADAHAFRVVAIGAERRGARGADPLAATLMTALLLGQPLPQGFEERVEATHRLDHRLLLLSQILLGELLQPFGRNVDHGITQKVEALEH